MGIHIQVHVLYHGVDFLLTSLSLYELMIFSIYPTHLILTKSLKTLYISDILLSVFFLSQSTLGKIILLLWRHLVPIVYAKPEPYNMTDSTIACLNG